MADNADNPEQHYQPEQTGMYELEFPAPQLSSADGSGPVMIHALEGFSDAGHAIRLAAAASEEHPGHRAGGVVRHRRTAGLPVATAADDVQDRPLHPLRGTRTQPVRPARQRRNAVSAARRHGAGPALGAVHHRGAAAGRTARRPSGHRPRHHPDGGAAHPPDHDDRARQRQGADRRPHAVGGRGAGAGQRVEPAGVPDGPARPRGGRLHRARSALSGADRLTPPPPRRCWPRSPRAARCRSRWRR